MANLDALLPAYREQYMALEPEIERSVRKAVNARGMFYSGEGLDAEARAKAELLAKLAGASAATSAESEERARDRSLQSSLAAETRKEGRRTALANVVGQGIGAGTTLMGLKYMNPQGGRNIFQTADGRIMQIGEDGTASAINIPGAPGADGGAVSGDVMSQNYGGPTSVPLNSLKDAPPSMWQRAQGAGMGGLAAALGGGAAGAGLSNLIGGRSSTAGNIGAGAGALGGAAFGLYRGGSPWSMGLGALLGSTGGGLLGNLFA